MSSTFTLPECKMEPYPSVPLPQMNYFKDIQIIHPNGRSIAVIPTFPPEATSPAGMPSIPPPDVDEDSPSGASGVPLPLIMDIMSVLSFNKPRGHLEVFSLDGKTSGARIESSDDDKIWLEPGNYTYIPGDNDRSYAVCTDFESWSPPTVVPERWTKMGKANSLQAKASRTWPSSNMSLKVVGEDKFCFITGSSTGIQTCDLVPKDQQAWWVRTRMSQLTLVGSTEAGSNKIAAIGDCIAHGMDQGHYTPTPYSGRAILWFFTEAVPDFRAKYYLHEVKIPPRVHPMCVYARFAWAIFKAFNVSLKDYKIGISMDSKTHHKREGAVKKKGSGKGDGGEEQDDEESGDEESGDEELGDEEPGDEEQGNGERDAAKGSTKHKRRCDNGDGGREGKHQHLGTRGVGDEDNEDGTAKSSTDRSSLETSSGVMLSKEAVEVAERIEADLLCMSPEDQQLHLNYGLYVGRAQIMRTAYEYRKAHPEISAVRQ